MKHIHKYQRILLGAKKIAKKDGKRYIERCAGTEYMKCMFPGCSHFILLELAIGRESICWACEDVLILNKENMTRTKPTHKDCRRKKEIAA